MNTLPFSQPKNSGTDAGEGQPSPLPEEEPSAPAHAPSPIGEGFAEAQLEYVPPPQVRETPRWLGRLGRQLCLLGVVVALSAVSYVAMSRLIVTGVVIQGKSMTPTLQEGDRYLLNRWALKFRNPERGEIVVIHDPGHTDFAVKRIVGVPLDSIQLKNGDIYLNHKLLIEPYLRDGTRTYSKTSKENMFLLGRNRYFVLGDNRKGSEDSRFYGSIRRDQIVGVIDQ